LSLGKKNIAINISSKTHISNKEASKFLDAFLFRLKKYSSTNNIKISNFGTFYKHYEPERMGRNPKTNQEFKIAKRTKIKLRSSNTVKAKLN